MTSDLPSQIRSELGDSAVNLTLRVWCLASDLHDMKFDLTKAIKERFDQAGISIPYPHMEVVYKESAGGPPRAAHARS